MDARKNDRFQIAVYCTSQCSVSGMIYSRSGLKFDYSEFRIEL